MEHEFWLQHWREGLIGFHQSTVQPLLAKYWATLGLAPGSRVFVPLAGKSLDMLWLVEQGHRVLGVELSPLAVEQFFAEHELKPVIHESRYGKHHVAGPIELICGDVFALDAPALADCSGVYDRAALVALPPAMRSRYAAELYARLPAGSCGLLLTFEYPQAQMQGPPFSVPEVEVHQLFTPIAELEMLDRREVLDTNPELAARGLSALTSCAWRLQRRVT